MKKSLLMLMLVVLMAGCKKKDEDENCYNFELTTTQSVSPSQPPYPFVSVSTFSQCGITDDEAQIVADSYKSTTTEQDGGSTFTTTKTCTFRKR